MQSYGIYSFSGMQRCSRSKGCYFNDIYLFVNIFPRSFPSLDVRQKKLTCCSGIPIHPPLGNSGVALIEQCDSEAGFLKQIDNRADERTLRTLLARRQERESAHHEIDGLRSRHQACHARLPPCSGIGMENAFLHCCVDGTVDLRQKLLRLLSLSFFHEINDLSQHGLHVRLKRKETLSTRFVLAGSLDGRLNQWHRSWERVGEGQM